MTNPAQLYQPNNTMLQFIPVFNIPSKSEMKVNYNYTLSMSDHPKDEQNTVFADIELNEDGNIFLTIYDTKTENIVFGEFETIRKLAEGITDLFLEFLSK